MHNPIFQLPQIVRIGIGNRRISFVAQIADGYRTGMRVRGGNQDVCRGHARLLTNSFAGSRDQVLRHENDIVGNQQQLLPAVTQVECGGKQPIVDARADPFHVRVTVQMLWLCRRNIRHGGTGCQICGHRLLPPRIPQATRPRDLITPRRSIMLIPFSVRKDRTGQAITIHGSRGKQNNPAGFPSPNSCLFYTSWVASRGLARNAPL